MKKWKCTICGAVFDSTEKDLDRCPVCGAPKDKIIEFAAEAPTSSGPYGKVAPTKGPLKWLAEHYIGIAKDAPEEIKEKLRGCFKAETSEVGMYLAMSRQAFREGYPEIGRVWEQIAFEEAEHASKFCEAIGEDVAPSTQENLIKMIYGENGANHIRYEIAHWAKVDNRNDALHDLVHEIARDEARHGKAQIGLLKRYFNKTIK
ncbi:ferritin family protein [Mycoplasma sp. SG1]|uniref:ferritin family protein n=1 Tax=Mycoplasma sp. SG1 TaxID=2810348 RepID=UPI0020241592|nr:ferritin family protein [Mycoplasma sp. SG1]URM52853.1 hypothetical protein JRW51_00715 [Mycoplasma sp. SG1]